MKQEMKKTLLSTLVLAGVLASAQVGINTEEPKAMLDIRGANGKEGDLRIEDVVELKKANYDVLVWSENDKTVKRVAISDIIWDLKNEDNIEYIKEKYPDKAENIIEKIKQCEPENRVFDKKFGDGSHDFVYCAVAVNINGYKKTWLNTNLGAEYSKVGSPDFNPAVASDSKIDHKAYGSLFQFAREADGHELMSWSDSENGSPVNPGMTWYSYNQLNYTQQNDPCPAGYHVPTKEEWGRFYEAITGTSSDLSNSDKMWIQTQLANLAAAGSRYYRNGSLYSAGSLGYYWSSTTNGSNTAYSIYFSSSSSYPSSYNFRSHGFSVRCIKD